MSTKQLINSALRTIGRYGFDGISLRAKDPLRGVRQLLAGSGAKNSDYSKVLGELRRQGLIEISQEEKSVRFVLSPAGAYRLQKIHVREIAIPRQKRWDGKWRAVSFDAPLRQSPQRAAFTAHLKSLDFAMLQRSLWVYPYPCFAQVQEIASYYNMLRWCTLFEISQLDELSTNRLQEHFDHL